MWPSEKVERVDRIPVVGSAVLYMNTDNAADPLNGWIGKIVGETRKDGTHLYSVRWYNGLVDHEVIPANVVHV